MISDSPSQRVIKLAVIVSVAILLLAPPLTTRANISISPRKITFQPSREGSFSGSFTVTNTRNSEVTLSINLVDWQMKEAGKVKLVPAGSLRSSLHELVINYPNRIILSPQESKDINFKVEVPAKPGVPRWGAFLIRPIKAPEKTKKGLHVGIQVQYTVTLYQEAIGEIPKECAITRLSIERSGSSEWSAIFRIKNESSTFLRPSGVLEIRNRGSSQVVEKAVRSFLVLPNHDRIVEVELGDLSAGSYLATLLLDYGTENRVGAKRKFAVD